MTDDTRTSPPDFDLAPLTGLDPGSVVSRAQPSPFESFMLALALFYNDWKGLAWFAECVIRPHLPNDDLSPLGGQLHGMHNHLFRLRVGMLHELMVLIKTDAAVAEGREITNLISTINASGRKDWKALVATALGKQAGSSEFTRALVRVRNAVSFHYYAPKSLVKGYRKFFFESPTQPKSEAAYCSIGRNMEGTRFYYADAAADTALTIQAEESGATNFMDETNDAGHAVNIALGLMLQRFAKDRVKTKRRKS